MQTLFRKVTISLALGMAVLTPGAASADHWHGHFGFYFGVPLYAPYAPYYHPQPFYPYGVPYYYPPAPYIAPPPVYVERDNPQATPQPPESAYWYYCPDSNAYYPYVAQCASPWQRVPTLPPATAR